MSGSLVVLFVLFALIGAPLFAVFGAASLVLFEQLPNTPITGAANDVFGEKFANSLLLVTIPLFTFAGYLMAESGTPKRLVNLSKSWIGWLPGGLAIVALLASAFFTTFTGGSGITIVAIGGLLYPALMAGKYSERFSLGMVTAGGSLGLLFPPSVPVILYGVVAGVLIEKLFLAGLIPGVLTLVALAAYSIAVGVRAEMPRTEFNLREAIATTWEAKWEVLLPVVLIGGLISGVLRIHEAAAFTAVYVLVIEVFVYRDIKPRELPKIIRESMTLVGAIMAILATAIGFTAYLIQAEVPQKLLEMMEVLVSDQLTFLFALNIFLILVGMLMDIFSAIVVVVPLIVPIAHHFGVDPYHLGIVFLLNLEIGYLTPPVGLNLFIASFRFDKPVTLLYRAVLPFIGLLLVALALTTYVPALSTYLTQFHEGEEILDFAPNSGNDMDSIDLDAPLEPEGESLDDLLLDLEGDSGDEAGLGGLDALEAELAGDTAAPGSLDALEAELGGDAPAPGSLDALEAELGGDAPAPGSLDALEAELGGDAPAPGSLDALEAELGGSEEP